MIKQNLVTIKIINWVTALNADQNFQSDKVTN